MLIVRDLQKSLFTTCSLVRGQDTTLQKAGYDMTRKDGSKYYGGRERIKKIVIILICHRLLYQKIADKVCGNGNRRTEEIVLINGLVEKC